MKTRRDLFFPRTPVALWPSGGTGSWASHFDGNSAIYNGNPQAQIPSGIVLPTTAQFFTFAGVTRKNPGQAGLILENSKWNSTPVYPSETTQAFYAQSVFLEYTTGAQVGLSLASDVNYTHSNGWFFTIPDDGSYHEWAISVRTDTRQGAAIVDGSIVSVTSVPGNLDPGGAFSVPLDSSWAWISGANIGNATTPAGSPPAPMQFGNIYTGDSTECMMFCGPGCFTDFANPNVRACFWNSSAGVPAEPGSWVYLGVFPAIYLTGPRDVYPTNPMAGTWANGNVYTDTSPSSMFSVIGALFSIDDPWWNDATVSPRR